MKTTVVLPSSVAGASWMQVGGHVGGSRMVFALVDDGDASHLATFRWSYLRGYASTRMSPGTRELPTLLHRYLLGLGCRDGGVGDHRNRIRLDNRRSNLRVLTPQGNSENTPARSGGTSRYRGVSWCKRDSNWLAQAQVNRKQHNLGHYATEEEAAEAAATFRRKRMAYAGE